MSNLIKSVYFNMNPSSVHVIDSDERVEEYIPDIYEPHEAEPFAFPSLGDSVVDGDATEFESGMPSIISMQDVVDAEKAKLAQELAEKQEAMKDEARQEAERILEQARQEADGIREQARGEGIRLGREEGMEEANRQLVQMQQELQAEYDNKFQELTRQEEALEPEFAELVISLVRKLTGVVCENKKDVILYLLGSALKNLERPKQVTVRVSREDIGRVTSKKATLQLIAGVDDFEVAEDEQLTENQCIIETDSRIIDCSLDVQLQNLEEHIKLLAL